MSEDPTILTILFAVLVGSFGGSVGSFFTYRATMKQIDASLEQVRMTVDASLKQVKMTVLSGSRQDWINRLRSCLAEYQRAIVVAGFHGPKLKDDKESTEFVKLRNEIELLLNPNEKGHIALMTLVSQVFHRCMDLPTIKDPQGYKVSLKQIGELQINLTKQAQTVLKEEWERVKQGE